MSAQLTLKEMMDEEAEDLFRETMDEQAEDLFRDVESDAFVNESHGGTAFQQNFSAWPGAFQVAWPLTNHQDLASETQDNGNNSGGDDIDISLCDSQQQGRSRTSSLVNGLLTELYDTYRGGAGSCYFRQQDSVDSSTEASGSDAFLGRSNPESGFLQELSERQSSRHQMQYLRQKEPNELKAIKEELNHRIAIQSAKLLRQVKQKDRLQHKLQKNCDIVTACLQAVSQKRRVDTKLKFTLEPSLGQNGFQQWYDALKAVARLPTGIPKEWRKRVWLNLADHYLHSISIDWDKTMRFTFNDRSNPDDDSMGIQIVKDLHRTGCSSYCGQEAEQDRVVLKRVLLAYARWNKTIGYCQGFNILAALILEVMEGNEGDALKVMIYLIDKVLPDSYFANNLRALSVDMAVFRDLLTMKLPELSQHLDVLQRTANKESGGGYEPPLTNVFTMQWFLTLFATCLPNHTVLKIWDSVFFEGSEILLRVSLAIWAKLGEQMECCQNSDDFYSTMGRLTQEMLEDSLIDSNDLMQTVYSMAQFPFPQLAELREKYTYNITPFPAPVKSASFSGRTIKMRDSDEENEIDEDDFNANSVGCLGPFSGFLAPELQKYQKQIKDQKEDQSLKASNIAELSPGAIDSCRSEYHAVFNSMMMERMTTDINALKQQYSRIKKRQLQQINQVFIAADKGPVSCILPSQVNHSPVINHLLLGKKLKQVNRSKNIVHLPASKSSLLANEETKAKQNSPWRTHIRVHRKNIARAKGELGHGDTIGLIEEQNEVPKDQTDNSKETEENAQPPCSLAGEETSLDRTVMKVDGHSPEPVYQDENANVTVVQSKLEALELSPDAKTEVSLEMSQTFQESQSDCHSSSSECESFKKSPKVQVFSPFPNVKPLRKSATARNLGLYGPNGRTPTVHFPHMSKTFNKAANGTTGSKKR
ncbi:TBC1 domain family member 30 isoform X2 [Xenopus laevis]|uniref:TBC1 domain family member 30 n=1 Tax=Xenopus laevis TaxID=8355 RepID=A0A8J0UXP2_XENLA|nr:TBC1 domain family member 30 isoform X2 [Xenopus laevis]